MPATPGLLWLSAPENTERAPAAGLPISIWLKTLKASTRKSSLSPSVIAKVLQIAASKFQLPGPSRPFRGKVPNVPSGAITKAHGLNQCATVFTADGPTQPGLAAIVPGVNGFPTRSGLSEPTPERDSSSPSNMLREEPDDAVNMPEPCQPPAII